MTDDLREKTIEALERIVEARTRARERWKNKAPGIPRSEEDHVRIIANMNDAALACRESLISGSYPMMARALQKAAKVA